VKSSTPSIWFQTLHKRSGAPSCQVTTAGSRSLQPCARPTDTFALPSALNQHLRITIEQSGITTTAQRPQTTDPRALVIHKHIATMSNNQYYGGGYPQQPQPSYGPPQGYPPQQGGYYQQGPPMQYGQPPQQQYVQQQPPPRQQKDRGCLTACLATLCCCFVCEEGCECCADCCECAEDCC